MVGNPYNQRKKNKRIKRWSNSVFIGQKSNG